MDFPRIDAVLFDMDGTLVDSEPLSWRAIQKALEKRGLSRDELEAASFHGVTWVAIAQTLSVMLPEGMEPITADELQNTFHRLHLEEPPPMIPGAHEALLQAKKQVRTAICTSSHRQSLEALLHRLKLLDLLSASISAEDCTRSKPDPEGYRLAAARLGVAPGHCLVFEDSLAGVQAAKAAGMKVVAIVGQNGEGSAIAREAHDAIADYTELPLDFFATLGR